MSTPLLAKTGFTADYRRGHGAHSFVTHEGQNVTSLSGQTWDETIDQLATIPVADGYIMTPELITCAGMDLADMGARPREIAEKLRQVETLSIRHPEAVIGLGTVACTPLGITNQLVLLQSGIQVGAINKNFLTYPEEPFFARGEYEGKRWSDDASTQFAICSEIVRVAINGATPQSDLYQPHRSNTLNARATTLLVSGCWAVPMSSNSFSMLPDDERYGGQLEKVVTLIFAAYPNLIDIIMTDRKPSNGTVDPYNVHFQRT